MPDQVAAVPPAAVVPKKTQEDINIEVYESVFKKCLGAANRITDAQYQNDTLKSNQVAIAIAIFDRFYNDQTAMKAGAIQAKAMIDAMTQVLEGRR